MDRIRIIEMIINNKKYTKEEKEIIAGIQEAMLELEVAKNSFDNVNDKNLVDICIHKEDQAKSKYIYYLSRAKEINVTVNGESLIEHLEYNSKW